MAWHFENVNGQVLVWWGRGYSLNSPMFHGRDSEEACLFLIFASATSVQPWFLIAVGLQVRRYAKLAWYVEYQFIGNDN